MATFTAKWLFLGYSKMPTESNAKKSSISVAFEGNL